MLMTLYFIYTVDEAGIFFKMIQELFKNTDITPGVC